MADQAQFDTPDSLASAVKAKYPAYASIPNADLAKKVLDKHPQYWQSVNAGNFAKAGMWQPSSTYQKTQAPSGQGEQSRLGKVVDKTAQGIVNQAPSVGTVVGGIAGTAAGGIGAVGGAAAGAAAGEAFKEHAEGKGLHDISNKEVAKQAAFGGLTEATGIGAGKVLGKAVEAIPSAKHAGQVLNEIEHAAGGVPVNLKHAGDALLKASELGERGSTAPKAVKQLIARYTNPDKTPLTYSEARDFMTNFSKLSAAERQSLKGPMKRQLAQIADGLQKDIAAAANEVGESARYYAGVKEYARAKRLASVANAMTRTLGRYGFKAALGAAGAGAAGALGYELAKGALRPAADNMPGGTSGDLSVLPESFQKTLEGAKVTQGKPTATYGGKQDIATVEEGDPKNITVRDSSRMSAPVLAHETTHLEQSNWDPKVRAQFPKDDPNKPYLQAEDFYKFPAMRQKGMTAKDLPEEHQAQVMQAYTQYPSMRKMLQPWVDDMAKFKKSNVLPTGPEDKSINTTPRAPEAPDWAYQPLSR